MEEYLLQADEVILFKGDALYGQNKTSCEIIQTNINLVAVFRTKKMFKKETVDILTFPMNSIKYFKNVPQVKQKGYMVELFFTNQEVYLEFSSRSSASQLVRSVLDVLSEEPQAPRAVGIVKNAIGVVDSTLGINTVETVVGVMSKGVAGTILGEITKQALGGNQTVSPPESASNEHDDKTSAPLSIGSENPSNAAQALSIDEQIEALKKLKNLLDSGIITEEEFNTKKSQIMGL